MDGAMIREDDAALLELHITSTSNDELVPTTTNNTNNLKLTAAAIDEEPQDHKLPTAHTITSTTNNSRSVQLPSSSSSSSSSSSLRPSPSSNNNVDTILQHNASSRRLRQEERNRRISEAAQFCEAVGEIPPTNEDEITRLIIEDNSTDEDDDDDDEEEEEEEGDGDDVENGDAQTKPRSSSLSSSTSTARKNNQLKDRGAQVVSESPPQTTAVTTTTPFSESSIVHIDSYHAQSTTTLRPSPELHVDKDYDADADVDADADINHRSLIVSTASTNDIERNDDYLPTSAKSITTPTKQRRQQQQQQSSSGRSHQQQTPPPMSSSFTHSPILLENHRCRPQLDRRRSSTSRLSFDHHLPLNIALQNEASPFTTTTTTNNTTRQSPSSRADGCYNDEVSHPTNPKSNNNSNNNNSLYEYRGIQNNLLDITKRGISRGNYAQLHRKAWLEVSDKHHRYGKNLRLYYKHWESLGHPTNMFFDWLDSKGEASGWELPNLVECRRGVLDSDRVLYITKLEEQEPYLLKIVPVERQPLDNDGGGNCPVGEGSSSAASTSSTTSSSVAGLLPAQIQDDNGQYISTGPNGWIFVLRDHQIYGSKKSISSKRTHRFHHSTFFGGKAVASAGIMITNDRGYLKFIYPHSGHYRPGEAHIQRMLFHFYRCGVDMNSFKVDMQGVMHVSREVRDKMTPGGNGEKVKKSKKTETIHLVKAMSAALFLGHKARQIRNGLFDQIHDVRLYRGKRVAKVLDAVDGGGYWKRKV